MTDGIKHKNVVLIGFMGTGKTSIGRLIASRLGYDFVDTDQLVVEKTGSDITDIFREHGEEYFRDQEMRALESLKDRKHLVVATGGGIITRPANIPLLKQLGFVVWLTADREVIHRRVSATDKRPLLRTEDPRKTIDDLMEKRTPLYAEAAQFVIDTSILPHPRIAEMIISEARQ